MKEKILNAITSPKELEALYQGDPEEFRRIFPDVFHQKPDSIVLQVWNERLNVNLDEVSQSTTNGWKNKNIFLVVGLSLIAGFLIRLPIVNYETVDPDWFFSRNLGGILIISLMAYFYFQQPQIKKITIVIFLFTVGLILYLNFLPFELNGSSWDFHKRFRAFDDSITVAQIHVPLFLWLLLGAVFAGKTGWIVLLV